jgi:hypothetical protein
LTSLLFAELWKLLEPPVDYYCRDEVLNCDVPELWPVDLKEAIPKERWHLRTSWPQETLVCCFRPITVQRLREQVAMAPGEFHPQQQLFCLKKPGTNILPE